MKNSDLDQSTASSADHSAITKIANDGVGQHVLIDLFGCQRIDDQAYMAATLNDCIEAFGMDAKHIHLQTLENSAISAVVVLGESHINVHTWPQQGFAAFDLFLPKHYQADVLGDILKRAFHPQRLSIGQHDRGT